MNEIDSLFVRNSKFVDNGSQSGGGAISLNAVRYSMFNNVEFLSNRVNSNDSQNSAQGGAVVIFNQFEDELTNTFFINCIFENNGIINEANQGSANGGVFYINSGSRCCYCSK